MAISRGISLKKLRSNLFGNTLVQKVFLGLFFFFSLTILIFMTVLPQKYDIKVGDVLQESIIARKEAVDTIATKKLQQAAADAVSKKYTLDNNVILEVKNEITQLFNSVREVQAQGHIDDDGKLRALKKKGFT